MRPFILCFYIICCAAVAGAAAADHGPDRGHQQLVTSSAGSTRQLRQACAKCNPQLGACLADATCAAYLSCVAPCGTDLRCFNYCVYRFADSTPVQKFNACAQAHDCNGPSVPCTCPAPNPTQPKARSPPLHTLLGTYDIVHGFSSAFDCFPLQQYRFPTTKHSSRFTADYWIRIASMNGTTIPIKFKAPDSHGAYVTSYKIAGVTASDTWYILDSTSNSKQVMVVYCADINIACVPGGFVLSKRGSSGPARPLSSGTINRFTNALVNSGWAARYNASWDKWCPVVVV